MLQKDDPVHERCMCVCGLERVGTRQQQKNKKQERFRKKDTEEGGNEKNAHLTHFMPGISALLMKKYNKTKQQTERGRRVCVYLCTCVRVLIAQLFLASARRRSDRETSSK